MRSVCAGLVAAMLLAGGVWAAEEPDIRTVTVTGEGIRTVEPEYAEVIFHVEIVRPDPATAKTEADAIFARLMSVLARFKIKEEDINSAPIEVRPKQAYERDSMVFKGYEVVREAKVTLRKLNDLEPLLKLAVEAGVNNVRDIELCHSRRAELEREAQKEACAQAKEKAAFFAAQFGAELGPIRHLIPHAIPGGEFIAMAGGGSADPFASAPESTFKMGRINIRAAVQVVFDLVPRK